MLPTRWGPGARARTVAVSLVNRIGPPAAIFARRGGAGPVDCHSARSSLVYMEAREGEFHGKYREWEP
jgi:hypothetical protein